jgi:hypothetical protein
MPSPASAVPHDHPQATRLDSGANRRGDDCLGRHSVESEMNNASDDLTDLIAELVKRPAFLDAAFDWGMNAEARMRFYAYHAVGQHYDAGRLLIDYAERYAKDEYKDFIEDGWELPKTALWPDLRFRNNNPTHAEVIEHMRILWVYGTKADQENDN